MPSYESLRFLRSQTIYCLASNFQSVFFDISSQQFLLQISILRFHITSRAGKICAVIWLSAKKKSLINRRGGKKFLFIYLYIYLFLFHVKELDTLGLS